MTPKQVIAILSIRQWRNDRTKLNAGITTSYKRTGYRERRQRDADARIVRTVDFERALAEVPPVQQTMLISAYYLGHTRPETAAALGLSVRAISYKLPIALDALAEVLTRRDLI
jgi:DNA-directed RNA polymerase specialized sigma24 family protein